METLNDLTKSRKKEKKAKKDKKEKKEKKSKKSKLAKKLSAGSICREEGLKSPDENNNFPGWTEASPNTFTHPDYTLIPNSNSTKLGDPLQHHHNYPSTSVTDNSSNLNKNNIIENTINPSHPSQTSSQHKKSSRILLIDDENPTINYKINPNTDILKILKHVLSTKLQENLDPTGGSGVAENAGGGSNSLRSHSSRNLSLKENSIISDEKGLLTGSSTNLKTSTSNHKGIELAIFDSNRNKISNISPMCKIKDIQKMTNNLPLRIGVIETNDDNIYTDKQSLLRLQTASTAHDENVTFVTDDENNKSVHISSKTRQAPKPPKGSGSLNLEKLSSSSKKREAPKPPVPKPEPIQEDPDKIPTTTTPSVSNHEEILEPSDELDLPSNELSDNLIAEHSTKIDNFGQADDSDSSLSGLLQIDSKHSDVTQTEFPTASPCSLSADQTNLNILEPANTPTDLNRNPKILSVIEEKTEQTTIINDNFTEEFDKTESDEKLVLKEQPLEDTQKNLKLYKAVNIPMKTQGHRLPNQVQSGTYISIPGQSLTTQMVRNETLGFRVGKFVA